MIYSDAQIHEALYIIKTVCLNNPTCSGCPLNTSRPFGRSCGIVDSTPCGWNINDEKPFLAIKRKETAQ